jgi:hypothetical protein
VAASPAEFDRQTVHQVHGAKLATDIAAAVLRAESEADGGCSRSERVDDAARNVGVLVEVVAGTNSVVAVCDKEGLAAHQEDG